MTEKSPALLALSAAAAALPGITSADEWQVDYRSSFYREQAIEANKLAGGSAERFEIDSQFFKVSGDINDTVSVAIDLEYETLSGASPWFVIPGANNQPMQVMSGATIDEERVDILGAMTLTTGDNSNLTLSAGYSDEDDYEAANSGVAFSWTPAKFSQTTLSFGVGLSEDHLTPTEGGTSRFPMRVESANRDSQTGFVGISHIFNRNTVAQASYSLYRWNGFLSDPYKEAFVENNRVADSRPTERRGYAATIKVRRFINSLRSAMHFDYNFFNDDWNIVSHTADTSWHQRFGERLRGVLGLRYYSQSRAFFYAPFYVDARDDGFASSDYRLSQHAAISARLNVKYKISDWALRAGVEAYRSDTSYTLEDAESENPGLVDFEVYSVGLSKSFGR